MLRIKKNGFWFNIQKLYMGEFEDVFDRFGNDIRFLSLEKAKKFSKENNLKINCIIL